MRISRSIKVIYQYDKKGNIINVWQSTYEIGKQTDFNCNEIRRCCRNERKTVYKFVWSYEELTKEEVLEKTKRKSPSKTNKGVPNLKKRKSVYQLDLEGNIIRKLELVEVEKLGFSKSKVVLCCQNKRKTHKGFKWRYVI